MNARGYIGRFEGVAGHAIARDRERAEAIGFKRLNAMTLAAPAGFRIFQRASLDVPAQLSRVRIFSDDPPRIGERLRLEVFPRDDGAGPLTLFAEVAWVHPQETRIAKCEVGLVVTGVDERDVARLERLLC